MSLPIVEKMIMPCFFILFFIVVLGADQGGGQNECSEARCGENGPSIRFPFRLKDRQPLHCGYPGFELYCTSENETALELPIPRKHVFVSKINYFLQLIQVYDFQDYCGFDRLDLKSFKNLSIFPFQWDYAAGLTLFSCPLTGTSNPLFFRTYLSDATHNVYAFTSSNDIDVAYLPDIVSCTKMYDVSAVLTLVLSENFDVSMSWKQPDCKNCEAKGKGCRLKNTGVEHETECFDTPKTRKGLFKNPSVTAGIVLSSFVAILAVITIFHVYALDKNEKQHRKRIEKFLEDYKALKPSRYTYADIKKITNRFKYKLGQGAYGTVFKGKLSNDILVAVKVLNNSKGNGEEFINEVATIGQIHHVNVARLVGFCADGFRRALVYEFLPNDSLEKHISSTIGDTNCSLTWQTLQGIALGTAKGIEYLHQGCDQRILHFDIKPHNVLLDQNFTPKIYDFGMAKLCSKDQSIVSMTMARGTMGYIAPEVFSRNFGNVSYKSDVYSYGMLLLEMVGGRKNNNLTEENAKQIYYPEWIYNILEEGEDLRVDIEEEGDARIAKKLAIVGLWCIQWHPLSRPTMKAVVQMLEGAEELTKPPNPFASSRPSK